jgi:hypothetical protein
MGKSRCEDLRAPGWRGNVSGEYNHIPYGIIIVGSNTLIKHLYNGLKLGKQEIESVATWKNEDGWDNALEKAASWLV